MELIKDYYYYYNYYSLSFFNRKTKKKIKEFVLASQLFSKKNWTSFLLTSTIKWLVFSYLCTATMLSNIT